MNPSWKTVRVFISSTFLDMQAERDWLVRFVFPRLREQLLPFHIHLVDVDLRWGVTSDQDALEVCRDIIDECRPRFLCMLGGRYGWVPPGKTRSITADEVHYGVLDRPGTAGGFTYFYFRNDAATEAMAETSPGEFREPAGSENRIKLAELKKAIVYTGLKLPAASGGESSIFKEENNYIRSLTPGQAPGNALAERFNPFLYPAQWDNDSRRLTGLKPFGDRVYNDLLAGLKSDPELGERFTAGVTEQPDAFAEENEAMEAYVEERIERFVLGSREKVLNELSAHAGASGGNAYCCLTGAAGSGKSALLAFLSRDPVFNGKSTTLLIKHFVGASPASTDMRRMLLRLFHEVKEGCPGLTAEIPKDLEEFRIVFPDLLKQACARKRVVLLIDAVNQLDPGPHSSLLHWMPGQLPPNARVILSALDGPALEELRSNPNPPREIRLDPLTAADGEAVIDQFSKRYHKKLEPEQRAALLAKTDAGMPLYLVAALEELRTLGTYDEISRHISQLPPVTRDFFRWILNRLENDDGFRDPSGRRAGHDLVSRFSSLLCASRYGLSQRELADLIDSGDAQGNVAALLHLLRPYLMHRRGLLDFYHGKFRMACETAWMNTDEQRRQAHAHLADYFSGQDNFLGSVEEPGARAGRGSVPARSPNRRKLDELVFQRLGFLRHTQAGTPPFDRGCELLENLLTDLEFMEARFALGMGFELEQDYRRAIDVFGSQAENSGSELRREALRTFARFAELRSSIFDSDPGNVLQEAWNFQRDGRICEKARDLLKRPESADYLWVRLIHRPGSPAQSPLRRTFKRPGGYLRGLDVGPDGDHAAVRYGEPSGFVRELDGEGTNVEMLHLEDGRVLWKEPAMARSMIFYRHEENVCFVTGERDGCLRIWEPSSGRCLQVLRADAGHVTALASSDPVKILVSGHKDGKLCFWSADSGKCLGTIQAHKQEVRSLSFTPGGDALVSIGNDNRMLVWDARTRLLLGTFDWHNGQAEPRSISVSAMALSFDTRLLATGATLSYGGDPVRGVMAGIRIWELETGRCLKTLEGHEAGVSCLALSQDGRMLVSGGFDNAWKVWDAGTGGLLSERKEAAHGTAVALTGDGSMALSQALGGSLVLWDTKSGRVLHSWDGAKGPVRRMSIMPEGSIAVVRAMNETVILNASAGEVIYRDRPADDACLFRIARDGGGKLRCVQVSPVRQEDLNGWSLNPDGRMAFRKGEGFFEVLDVAGSKRAAEPPDALPGREKLEYRGFRLLPGRIIGVTKGGGSDQTGSYIWDVLGNKPLARLEGDKAEDAVFSVGGEPASVVTRDGEGLIRIWRLDPLACTGILPGHMDIGFDLKGDGDQRRAVRIDALADLPFLLDDSGAGSAPRPPGLRFNPRSDLAACPTPSGERVFHIPSCRRVSILLGKNKEKEQCVFSPDGGLAATGGFDESLGLSGEGPAVSSGRRIVRFWDVRFWDRAAGACLQKCTGLEEDISHLRADRQLKNVLTGYHSGTIQAWRFEGRPGLPIGEKETGRWALSRDGRLLAGGEPGHPRFHDLLHCQDPDRAIGHLREWIPSPIGDPADHPMALSWCEASSCVIVSNSIPDDPDLAVFRLDTGRMIFRLHGHTEPAASILISPDGAIAFSGGNDRTIHVWDIRTGRCINTMAMENESYRLLHVFQDPGAPEKAHPSGGNGTIPLKSWRIVIQRTFGAFSVVDASSGAVLHDIHRSSVIREDPVGVLPDGFSVLARTGSCFWVFDARTGEQRKIFKGHTDIVTACAFHAGAQVAVSSQWTKDARLWVWSLADGHLVTRLEGHRDQITSAMLSADGRYAISGSKDKTIRVWDLGQRVCRRTFHLDGPVEAVSPMLANGIFTATQKSSSSIMQLCRGWSL